MALIEEMDKSGNWLFRWRSFLPIVLYAFAAVVIVAEADTDMPLYNSTWALICLSIAMAGQVIRAITIGYTPKGTSGRNTKEGQVAEVLNTKGIYSTVRHPLYLGNFFMWMGIILYVGNWWFAAVCALLFWLYYERIMFAEEYFLRNKFGQIYINWSERTPAFWPSLKNWQSAGWNFSIKNVLKREYSGFFAVFLSFALVDAMKNYIHIGWMGWEELVSPFWLMLLIASLALFILLRTLKKHTQVLNVKDREYV
jgi:protein-S-isoprenylcysteine O-methyltransferase Ste14